MEPVPVCGVRASDSLLLPWRLVMGRGREINPQISLGEVLIRIHFQAFLSLVDQVSCRGVIFCAPVSIIKKKRRQNPKLLRYYSTHSC